VSKKLRTIAVLVLVLAGMAAYITFRNRPLSAEEKSQLLHALAGRHEEMEKQLRQTEYFSDLADTGKAGKREFVDFDQAANLWARACADKSFDDVKRVLAGDDRLPKRQRTSALSAAEKKPLGAAEKKQLFLAMTFRNEELKERLRLTKYFSGTVPVTETGSGLSVDADTSYYLWRRACADQSFAEVKKALGGHYHFVPPSYYFDGQ
jgi:hypothetical protein